MKRGSTNVPQRTVRRSGIWRIPCSVFLFLSVFSGANFANAGNFPLDTLGPYYQQALVVGDDRTYERWRDTMPYLVPRRYATISRVIGGGVDPPPDAYTGLSPVGRLVAFGFDAQNPAAGFVFYGYRDGVCSSTGVEFSAEPTIGQQVSGHPTWSKSPPGQTEGNDYYACQYFGGSPPNGQQYFQAREEYSFHAPVRRKTVDGGEYDASAMSVTRNGVPWASYFWAYRLGLVAGESDWVAANADKVPELVNFFKLPSPTNNFELVSLPPPRIEDEVVEFVNRVDFPAQRTGQYFYAVRSEDKALLDSTANWSRTGNTFKSGGYVSVCRFYGGKNGGPNTHFFSADDKECAALKAIPQLSYEGQTFATNRPLPATRPEQSFPGAVRDCPAESKPLYRLYNNASYSNGGYVSNHRYTTDFIEVAVAVREGWADEGHVMCVPE